MRRIVLGIALALALAGCWSTGEWVAAGLGTAFGLGAGYTAGRMTAGGADEMDAGAPDAGTWTPEQ